MAKTTKAATRGKLIISVGDEGAILIVVQGKKLVNRFFFENPSSGEFRKVMSQHRKLPAYMLVDVLDQAYIQHLLPPVSPLSIGPLVKRRLEKDFADEEIRAARKLGREKHGRKDWNYSFISVPKTPPFSLWLEALIEAPNAFKGFFLVPLECEPFLRSINRAYLDKGTKPSNWQLMVSHNKVGGFRQSVYKEGKLIFTRIAQPIGGQAPDVIAGNIEQETLNTIEYIRRLGFENDDTLDIIIICSPAVKSALETTSLHAENKLILTPAEISQKFGYQNASEKNDRFGDVVIAMHFANTSPVLRLESKETKEIAKFTAISTALRTATFIGVPLLLFLSVQALSNISTTQDELKKVQIQVDNERAKLDEVMKRRGELPKNSNQILEFINYHSLIVEESAKPFAVLELFSATKPSTILVQSATINVSEFVREGNEVSVAMKASYTDPVLSFDRQIEVLDGLTQQIIKKFDERNYEITFSGLPDATKSFSLDSAKTTEIIPLDINIVGPIDENTRQRKRLEGSRGRR